jgi:hypothetical protein
MTHFFRRKPVSPDTNHPAYAVGEQLGRWWLRQEQRVADALNAWQGRVSTRQRNVVLLTLFLAFAAYFFWLLF